MAEEGLPQDPDKQKLLECLHDANKRLAGAKKRQKQDATAHKEEVGDINIEIKEIMEQLDNLNSM